MSKKEEKVETIETCEKKAAVVRLEFKISLMFREKEQETLDMRVDGNIPENLFVATILENTGWDMMTLIKIDTCLMRVSVDDVVAFDEPALKKYFPKYLEKRKGKYYFNSANDDTKRWAAFRDGVYTARRMVAARKKIVL